ncbi:C-terminal binding protein [Microbacterium sp. KUDC0406]|uniref:C-terminal binding protein n=1 Tax=Microbacterium sp. KUDC0406 TaxID=2909588 RepID=UPI001F21A1F6|nr:C-terminal binding protein [Microbacterium sp. KUDC0406]UJP09887.1 C-terminal binding protein [Microbacterium sp. KUDC0406]
MTDARPLAVYTDVDDTDPGPGIALLEAHGFEVRVLGTRDPQAIVEGARDAVALLPGYAAVTREMIEALPNLEIIALMSMGFDYVDVDAAAEQGVWVTNVPGAATEEVATHALAIMLHSIRQLRFYTASANPAEWNERTAAAPPRLSEKTLGIIGLGKIGRELIRLAAPLFGQVIGYDPLMPDTPEVRADLERLGVRRAGLDEVRAEADVLSLHLPLTPETERMIDAEFLAGMRQGSVLVNVSRGALIDESALAAALDTGHLAGAALDVLATEPPQPDHPLLGRDDVVLTPHIAYFSERTEIEYVRIQAQNAVTLRETGAPDSPVNRPAPRA